MQGSLGLIILFIVFQTACSSSDVIDLNEKNFNDKVLKSDLPFMVEFFAPWCGHCKSLAPEWEKAATNLKGILPVGKVDCTVHQSLCSKYGVKGYPTIKCFSEKGKKVADYQQARQAAPIVRYATEQLPNNVASIKNTASLDKFLAKNPEIPHVLLFSSKSEISSLMKALSVSYKGRVEIGQVKQDTKEVTEKYQVDSFPTLISVQGSDEPKRFAGTVGPNSLAEFITSLLGEDSTSESSDSNNDSKTSPKESESPKTPRAKPKPAAQLVEVTQHDIDTTCGDKLCLVAFVDSASSTVEGEESSRAIEEAHKSVIDTIYRDFKGDGKFVFVWVDKRQSSDLVSKFGLSADEPSFVVYNIKRQRYAKAESLGVQQIHQLLERVVGGDVTYTKL